MNNVALICLVISIIGIVFRSIQILVQKLNKVRSEVKSLKIEQISCHPLTKEFYDMDDFVKDFKSICDLEKIKLTDWSKSYFLSQLILRSAKRFSNWIVENGRYDDLIRGLEKISKLQKEIGSDYGFKNMLNQPIVKEKIHKLVDDEFNRIVKNLSKHNALPKFKEEISQFFYLVHEDFYAQYYDKIEQATKQKVA